MSVSGLDLQLNSSTTSGAANVSLPIEGRERKVLRLRLLSLERRLDAPCVLVGVGGRSSTFASVSVIESTAIVRLAVGDWLSGRSSSPSTLTKLPRRWDEAPRLPKTLIPLPKDSVENFDTCALNGVLVVPNWGCGLWKSPNRLPPRFTSGVSMTSVLSACAGGYDCLFDGVSGITYRLAVSSALRFFFDIRPVENATGACCTDLNGVSNESLSPSGACGRGTPIGRDLEN